MSTLQSLVSSNNFPLLVIAIGFVVAGVVMLGVSAVVSLRTRETGEE